MNGRRIGSDQFYNWSEKRKHEETLCLHLAATSQGAPAADAPLSRHPPGLSHRTVQTVRQARMQVRRSSRPRAQVLPLRHAARRQAGDGLRALGLSRPGGPVPRELPFPAETSRADLRNQPRVAAPKRGTIEQPDGRRRDPPFRGYGNGRHPHRQHASVAVGGNPINSGGRT
jgi:hypothetical protein